MILSDYHMHSHYSGDSKTPTIDMINKSIELGLKNICFTEHYDPLFPCYKEEEKGMFDLDLDKYLSFANKCKADSNLQSNINVNFGMELGIYPGIYDICREITSNNTFDFIICSSHTAGKIDPYYPEYWNNYSTIEGATIYFEEILENINNFKEFDVYGHLDYCLRYTNSTLEERMLQNYKDVIHEIFKVLIENGKGIEINSGGKRSKIKEFNPSLDYIKMYKEMGGEIITFGSDAHDPSNIAFASNDATEVLKSAGFKYYSIFKNRKPEFINL